MVVFDILVRTFEEDITSNKNTILSVVLLMIRVVRRELLEP